MGTMNVKKLVMISLFIALQIILTRMLAINLPTIRIGFQFLPLALTGVLFGPIYGAIAATAANLIGVFLFPPPQGFFPGFTLTAAISGAVYGLFLYEKSKKIFNISLSVISVSLIQLILNTVWLYMMLDVGIMVMLPGRVTTTLMMIPVQISTLSFFCNVIVARLNLNYD